jgi:imidazolonepropionase-like amidohydrolase
MHQRDGVLVARAAFAAEAALAAGITTIRDCGARGDTTFALRQALELGYGKAPRLLLCGQPITITGGHCWYLGGEVDGGDALRRKVRQLVKRGADFIKVIGSGGGTPNTKSWRASFRQDEFVALVEEAHHLGRRITVHCSCSEAMEFAINAKADQIEHAHFMVAADGRQEYAPAVVDRLAEAGIAITPTLAVGEYAIRAMHDRSVRTPEEQAFLDRRESMLETSLVQLGRMYEAGVKVVAGTDAGWLFTPFDALADELVLMQRAGMAASDVLVAATSGAAAAIGIADTVGAIREGFDADLIAVEGEPLADLSALRRLRLVMQRGSVHVGTTLAVDSAPAK